MTQTAKSSRKVILGAGWANPLTHDYRVDLAADIHVFADTVELVQGVDYSVSGVGLDAGYSVTITSPGSWAPTNWVLDARPAIDQGADISVGGQFGLAYENALDKLTRRVQRVYDLAARAVKSSISTAVGVSYELPAPQAGMAIGWDDTGTGLENRIGISATELAQFDADVDAAEAAAVAAGNSATSASGSAASALASYNATVAAIAALGNPVVFKGAWDASGGTFPGAGAARAGWEYIVTVPGTVGGVVFEVDDILIAVANNASTTVYASNWYKLESDLVQSVAGLVGVITAAGLKTALAITVADVTDMSANGRSLVAATYSAMRTLLGLVIGTNVQAYDAQLSSLVPQNSQSAAYTFQLTDIAKHVYHPASDTTARTWTIPANASVAFPIGAAITIDNDFGAGALTIAITSDTLVLVGTAGSTGSRTLASGGQATALKVAATRWRISGVGLS